MALNFPLQRYFYFVIFFSLFSLSSLFSPPPPSWARLFPTVILFHFCSFFVIFLLFSYFFCSLFISIFFSFCYFLLPFCSFFVPWYFLSEWCFLFQFCSNFCSFLCLFGLPFCTYCFVHFLLLFFFFCLVCRPKQYMCPDFVFCNDRCWQWTRSIPRNKTGNLIYRVATRFMDTSMGSTTSLLAQNLWGWWSGIGQVLARCFSFSFQEKKKHRRMR